MFLKKSIFFFVEDMDLFVSLRPGCTKRCQFVVKVNILSSDLIGRYLTLDQPIKWADFRLDELLADTMLTKLSATGPKCGNILKIFYVS
jgi:hypothetical protein